MLKRESKFPSASRRTHFRNSSDQTHGGRRSPIFPVLFILILAAGLYIYQMPGRPWAPYLEQMQRILSDRDDVGAMSGPETTPARKTTPDPLVQDNSGLGKTDRKMKTATAGRPQAELLDEANAKPVQLDISIGMGFRPVGFRIGAVSRSVSVSPQLGKRIHRLPKFIAPQQRYGVIRLARGQEYGFALDLAASGYRMFLDRNRNGDLRDDGEPMLNQGKGLFASKLTLPLAQITGIPRLKGDYQLWVFTNPDSWNKGKIRYYSMTQLRGELLLKGQRYTVYLADNGPVDGDYRNDGISIDLNGDGKINRGVEFFTKGKPVRINGEMYSFRITK